MDFVPLVTKIPAPFSGVFNVDPQIISDRTASPTDVPVAMSLLQAISNLFVLNRLTTGSLENVTEISWMDKSSK